MVNARPGRSTLGCLLVLALLAAACYVGVSVARPYLRFYAFRDAMRQEARFARARSDAAIKQRLAALADSLGLPEDAGRIEVRRQGGTITLSTEYDEPVDLRLLSRDIRMSAVVEGSL